MLTLQKNADRVLRFRAHRLMVSGASGWLPDLAAVSLSSSPGEQQRTGGRESKGEAFVTRSVMNTPLQAKPVSRPLGRKVTGNGEELRETVRWRVRTRPGNRRAASAFARQRRA